MESVVGAPCVAIWHRTLVWATNELARLGQERLRRLKVNAGEHLAAILTTAFLGVPPSEIDTDGGVDLLFRFDDVGQPSTLRGSSKMAAFEVKSLPGPFRKVNAAIDRRLRNGEDAKGLGVTRPGQRARDVIEDARSWLVEAQSQLVLKTKHLPDCSRNAFLVVHPFDHFAVDSLRGPPLGPLLPKLTHLRGVDAAWVLWFPDVLTVWSKSDDGWTDLIFNAMNRDEAWTDDLTPLQAAEMRFLELSGNENGSPYLFGISPRR